MDKQNEQRKGRTAMETPSTICTGSLVTLVSLAGIFGHAAEPQLQLHGKTVTVYPIVLAEPGKPVAVDPHKMGLRVAEVVGVILEQHGMLPGIAPEHPESISPADSLLQVEKKLLAFQSGRTVESDYALFAMMEGRPTNKGPAFTRFCSVLTGPSGQVAWTQDRTEFHNGAPDCLMGACAQIVQALRSVSDLKEPGENVPPGPFQQRLGDRNREPGHDAMDKRFEAARGTFREATLTIYPLRIWGTEEGSEEGAEALAERLNEAGFFESATAAGADTHLKAKHDPSQPKVLWGTARDFRSYLREHPAQTDYALLVDVTIPAHHLHLVLCEGTGNWVMVDLQNSHHEDFKKIAPKTLKDCVALAFQRMKRRIE